MSPGLVLSGASEDNPFLCFAFSAFTGCPQTLVCGPSASIQPPASTVIAPATAFDLLASLLQEYLSLHWVHLSNPGSSSHLHYTITSVKSLLPCKVTHSRVPGFRAWIGTVVQLLSHVQLFATPWTATCQASLSFTIYQSLLKLMSIESVMLPNHLILYRLLLLLPSIFPSIRVFFNESALHIRWPKYCSFSFSISPSNEYSGLISFRIDWFDLLVVQGTLKTLLQQWGTIIRLPALPFTKFP